MVVKPPKTQSQLEGMRTEMFCVPLLYCIKQKLYNMP